MTWVRIERTPRPFLATCHSCGRQSRIDQEPWEMEYRRFDRVNPPRPSVVCRNIDCRMGPAARELRERLRADPCPSCKGEGSVTVDGMEYYCGAEGCEASRLLQADHAAGERFTTSSSD